MRADRKVAQIFRDAHETYSTFRRIDLPDVDRGHGVRLHRLWPMFRMASTKPGRPPSITACSPTHREQRLLPATCAIMTQPSGAASQAKCECDEASRRKYPSRRKPPIIHFASASNTATAPAISIPAAIAITSLPKTPVTKSVSAAASAKAAASMWRCRKIANPPSSGLSGS